MKLPFTTRAKPARTCPCPKCKDGRRLERIARKPSKRDAEFIMGMFGMLLELSEEVQGREEAGRN